MVELPSIEQTTKRFMLYMHHVYTLFKSLDTLHRSERRSHFLLSCIPDKLFTGYNTLNGDVFGNRCDTTTHKNKKAALSQGGPRDADVNFKFRYLSKFTVFTAIARLSN